MKLRFWNHAGLAAIFLVIGFVLASAEEPVRQRGTPIIFSEPKSDMVSSNLNQLDLKVSPFKGLESNLKKPFEIFDSGRFMGNFRPSSGRIAPPTAPANNQRLQELIDKRAEMMLPGPESGDPDLTADDLFKTAEDPLDATGRKPKTPLDRYYNRLDRERAAFTNQMRNTDLFGNNQDSDSEDQFGRRLPDKLFGGDLKASASSLGRMSNNAVERGGFFSDRLKPQTFDDLLDGPRLNAPSERRSVVKETRLDEFKRLLDRPAYTSSRTDYSSPGLPVAATALRPATAAPLPTWSSPWSSPSVPANHRDSFTSRAGLVGALPQLQSLPSLATTPPSLNLTPPPVLRATQPASSFSIPKRQF